MRRNVFWACLAIGVLTLAGCSGGGDDDDITADDDGGPDDDDSRPDDDSNDDNGVADDDTTDDDVADDDTTVDDDTVDDDVTDDDVADDDVVADDDTTDDDVADDDTVPAFWQPAAGTTWEIELSGEVNTSYDVAAYDIDLFDNDAATITALQDAGVKVICYFSAGSYEDWRDDAGEFDAADRGNPLAGWEGEWWLDVRSANVRRIMGARMDVAVAKGCDAVDPDNVDGYQNDNGLGLTKTDQLEYLRLLANEAHARGLAIGLKNALGLIPDVLGDFEFQVNEECLAYEECGEVRPFIDADKPVFHIEYIDDPAEAEDLAADVCGDPTIVGFSTLIKTWDLDSFRRACE